jgi:exonuclease VII small subunit
MILTVLLLYIVLVVGLLMYLHSHSTMVMVEGMDSMQSTDPTAMAQKNAGNISLLDSRVSKLESQEFDLSNNVVTLQQNMDALNQQMTALIQSQTTTQNNINEAATNSIQGTDTTTDE